jgi:hypothetical protein
MKRTSAALAALAIVFGTAAACKSKPQVTWTPVPGRIMTRWAADVRPDAVLPDYPRPQMVREKWLSLNGPWSYALTAKDAPRPEAWDGQILVPFAVESALSGVGKPVGGARALWYRRTVDIPRKWRGGRILLHFGAVDWQSTVWVNGRELGTHKGGYDPFTYDIRDVLKRGKRQEIVVRVWDPTDEENLGIARGKQVMAPHGIFYTAVTGIWQTVWLEPVPKVYINGLKLAPDVDRSTLTVEPVLVGSAEGARVSVSVSRDGKAAAQAEADAGEPVALALEHPALWSPADPALYDLRITLKKGRKTLDEVVSYAGMRKIAIGKGERGFNRLLLNDEPLFELGPLDQGWWPDGLYTAPTDAALRSDIETIKSLGMNMLRKHVKVEPDRLYYWCDKLGLLVWQDMPSALYDRDKVPAEARAARDAQFESEWRALMDARASHPSIVMWVPFNEGWGQYDTERITAWTKAHDPSRLVDNASGWTDKGVGDVNDIHSYPGPDMRPVEEKRASVLGEFGGLGLPLAGHLWQTERNWGYRNFDDTEAYRARYTELLRAVYGLVDKGLAAAVYTQTSDCEGEVNGLLTYDREVLKLDPARFAAIDRGFLPPRFKADQTIFIRPFFIVELEVRPGATMRVTVDGSDPTPESPLYDKPLIVQNETTVKARAYWPDGTASPVESRTFTPVEPAPAAVASLSTRGLAFEVYEGLFDKLPDFAALTPVRSGTSAGPDPAVAKAKERFAIRFRGYVRAPRTGVYVFYLGSDDGSRLAIDGREIIGLDGTHELAEKKAELALQAGWHAIELDYFQAIREMELELSWQGPGFAKAPIPAYDFGR